MTKISVIVPVYNVEPYLNRCVDSILGQTFTDFELLLVDDGTPDRSGEICDETALADSRIISIHKPNGGVSSARNCGLDLLTGQCGTFVDSDDYVDKCFITDLYRDDYDLICQNGKRVDESGRIIDFEVREFETLNISDCNTSEVEKLVVLDILGYTWGKLFKSEIVSKYCIRFDENLNFMEDLLFFTEYALHCSKIFTNNLTNYNYVLYNSISTLSNKRKAYLLEPARLAITKIDRLFSENEKSILYYEILSKYFRDLILLQGIKWNFVGGIKAFSFFSMMLHDDDFIGCCKYSQIHISQVIRKAVISKSRFNILIGCIFMVLRYYLWDNRIVRSWRKCLKLSK